MAQLYDQLGISRIKTIACHSEANGLVECFNGTLKVMLKKFVRIGISTSHICYLCTGKFLVSQLGIPHSSYCMVIWLHLCPGLHANVKDRNFLKAPKSVAIFAIFAKIANFAKNRKNRRTLKRKRTQGHDKSRICL